MGEIWEKAIERALCGQKDRSCVLSLALDGAVKCVNGRIPVPGLLQRFPNLGELSLANVGLSSLEGFPHLPNLRKLNLSDNRIAGSLDFLVKGVLPSLQDLDLSNSKIQKVDDLKPLEPLKLKALDLYESPVTRVKDYRLRVFELIKSLKYLDNMDCQGREKQSDDEDEYDDEDDDDDADADADDESDEEEEDYDPGSCEIIGNQRNGDVIDLGSEGIIGIDDDDDDDDDDDGGDEDDSDADEEVELIKLNDSSHQVNGHTAAVSVPNEDGAECDDEEDDDVVDDDDDEDEGDNEDSSESDEEEVADDDNCEHHQGDDVHEIIASDEDVVETVDLEDEVDHEGPLVQNHEIDGHEEGEEDFLEDDNGETGEDFFEDGDEEEDYHGGSYLVKAVDEELDGDDDDDDDDAGDAAQFQPPSARKRSHDGEEDDHVKVKKVK